MTTTAFIPFSGFYESDHDAILDDEWEQCFQNDDGVVNAELLDKANGVVNWKTAKLEYAKVYTEYLSDHMKTYWVKDGRSTPLWTFHELHSPREYNFTTDRIEVKISKNVLKKMLKAVGMDGLEAMARQHMTSRSGFHSFYNPDPNTWGPLYSWDFNQNGELVQAYCSKFGHFEKHWEWDLMESAISNGVISNLVWGAIPEDKASAIYDEYNAWREQGTTEDANAVANNAT